jgi:hypothetical protein
MKLKMKLKLKLKLKMKMKMSWKMKLNQKIYNFKIIKFNSHHRKTQF